jgi:hypothetical protein
MPGRLRHGSREIPGLTARHARRPPREPLRGQDEDARSREVGQTRSTEEPIEQRGRARAFLAEMVEGRGLAEGNPRQHSSHQAQYWTKAVTCAHEYKPGQASTPDAGARCGNSARRDLCGGRRATGGPTATRTDPWRPRTLGGVKASSSLHLPREPVLRKPIRLSILVQEGILPIIPRTHGSRRITRFVHPGAKG